MKTRVQKDPDEPVGIHLNHATEEPIGTVNNVVVDEKGLSAEITLRKQYALVHGVGCPPEPHIHNLLIPLDFENEVMDLFLRPNPLWSMFKGPHANNTLGYWQARQVIEIENARLRNRIPRSIRWRLWTIRRRLAGLLYPEAFYDEDDD